MDRAEAAGAVGAAAWLAAEMAARGAARVYGNVATQDPARARVLAAELERFYREWDYVPSFMRDEHGEMLPQVESEMLQQVKLEMLPQVE